MGRLMVSISLTLWIAVLTAVLTTVVLVLSGIIDGVRLWRSQVAALEVQATATATRLAGTIAVPLWNVDVAAADPILEAEMADPGLLGARVFEGADAVAQIAAGRAAVFAGRRQDPSGQQVTGQQEAHAEAIWSASGRIKQVLGK